nr:1-acyl-sn-glycerol-3-phosphate acyltransferase [Streptococcus thermophilus]
MDHFVTKTLANAVRSGEEWFPTKAEAFESFLSRVWHESMNCYPVDRDAPGEEVFRRAQDVLEDGGTLVLYPEGTRNVGAGLLPFKSGAFRMALANNAPVVPIGMTGLADVLPKGASVPRRRLFSVSIGEPLDRPEGGDERENARSMRDQAFETITELMNRTKNPSGADRGSAVDNMVQLAQTIVQENLTAQGSLPPAVVRRVELLLRIARKTSRRNLNLPIQETRLSGFKALNSRTTAGTVARAAIVNQRALLLSDLGESDDFSAYLAGRSALTLPRWLGGGPDVARIQFERAVSRGGRMTSQSYVGLAESFLKTGDIDAAIEAYRLAESNIPTDDPRGDLRREKIAAAVAWAKTESESN